MKTKAIKLVGLTFALFGVLTLAEAREGGKGKGSGDRDGGKKCQKQGQDKGDTGDRDGRKERFDKDGDGELSPSERKAAQRARQRRQGDKG